MPKQVRTGTGDVKQFFIVIFELFNCMLQCKKILSLIYSTIYPWTISTLIACPQLFLLLFGLHYRGLMRLSLTCSTPLFLNQLGDTWTSDCNNCICEKESMSVQCTPVSCPVEPSPDCSDPGYKSVNKTVDCCLKETCGELRFLSHLKYHCNFQGPKKRIFATWLFV